MNATPEISRELISGVAYFVPFLVLSDECKQETLFSTALLWQGIIEPLIKLVVRLHGKSTAFNYGMLLKIAGLNHLFQTNPF